MDELVLTLIDRIYASTLDPKAWQEVAEGLSAFFDDSAVIITPLPADRRHPLHYGSGISEDFFPSYLESLVSGLPRLARNALDAPQAWRSLEDRLPDGELVDTDFYREWMKPQGLAPHWPIGLSFVTPAGVSSGGIGVMRREGQEPLSEDQVRAADVFIPHLRRALELRVSLRVAQGVRLALSEAMDRLPTGVVLLDAQRHVVLMNRGAEAIAGQKDGIRIDEDSGVLIEDARAHAKLQALVADALEASEMRDLGAPGFLGVPRPSGTRAYALMVTPLVPEVDVQQTAGAVVAIFIADPSASLPGGVEALEELYHLTHSEAELVRLLSTGLSLEEAARERGVSLHTARSHLKRAFSKTDTSRQGELVRLIVTGVSQIRGS